MPITELLERNAELYGNDVALVEVNPEITEVRRKTWRDYDLIESDPISFALAHRLLYNCHCQL